MNTRAVFLDRDGTLMEDVGYCHRPEDVHVFAGVHDALLNLHRAGFLCIIITNQSGIGRGYFTKTEYAKVHAAFLAQLPPGAIDDTFMCPDSPGSLSICRKPLPQMVLKAAGRHDINVALSFFVGDKHTDVQCGKNAGTKTILVGDSDPEAGTCSPDWHASTFGEAARVIISQQSDHACVSGIHV